MIRVPVILAAAAALVLPAARYIDDALGTGARTLGASVALAAPGVASDKPTPTPPLHRLVHRDHVTVEEDGNGVQAARFATTFAGKDVRYVLLIENGCASSDPARPCPAPVTGLTVTLNDDVVFQNDAAFTQARSEITLNPAGTQLNSLVLAAKGAPGTAARIRIIAIRQPVDKSSARFAGLSEKPSNGLEPLTPSLPFWNQAGTRGHQRVTAVATVPQVGGI